MATETQTKTQSAEQAKYGTLCHFDLPIKDVERAKKFYGEIFGWSFRDIPEMDYTLFQTPGEMGGGFFKPSENQPAKVINYLYVASIEETAEKIKALGGQTVSPKIEIPGHGHMMHVVDSEGNLFALWQL